ncbi:MAG TPA: alkaline phosphatase family protein [Candidatus Dormibacteraeota bacterium]|nr:alkaline phosphatase family protein [Candidatus Dormibacteraeota bacterium]
MLAVFVLIDALGWRYLEDREFLNDILPYRVPLQTVLGFSSGAIPTILTGKPPAVTGHWNLFYYDPKGSPFRWLRFAGFLPDALLDNRVTRKLLKELGRRVLGMGPLFECSVSPRFLPLFNYVEKKNIYGDGGIPGSSSIFDELTAQGIAHRVYSYHHLSDANIIDQAIQDIQSKAASFFFLYLSEMDMFLHMHCNQPEKVEERLRAYEKGLRRVFKTAREVDPEATMTVVSDHGMTPVEHHYDVVGEIESIGLKMPGDYLAVYDSTMARFWFFNDKAKQSVYDRLTKLSCGRILPDEELRRLGVFFEDRRFGELIFLLHPGWLVSKGDFNGKGWMPIGMHGYHPQDSWSDAIFLSSNQPPVSMSTIGDVYSCMRNAAGLAPRVEGLASRPSGGRIQTEVTVITREPTGSTRA